MPACAQLESVLNTLEERLRQYHACCHRLALLPATAKRAGGVAYEMAVNRGAVNPQELISGDIKVCACVRAHVVFCLRGRGAPVTPGPLARSELLGTDTYDAAACGVGACAHMRTLPPCPCPLPTAVCVSLCCRA